LGLEPEGPDSLVEETLFVYGGPTKGQQGSEDKIALFSWAQNGRGMSPGRASPSRWNTQGQKPTPTNNGELCERVDAGHFRGRRQNSEHERTKQKTQKAGGRPKPD